MKQIDALVAILSNILALLNTVFKNRLVDFKEADSGEQMTRQEVKDYLGISESTYKRKVADGTLKPMRMPGGHRFRKADLFGQFMESKRRGRI